MAEFVGSLFIAHSRKYLEKQVDLLDVDSHETSRSAFVASVSFTIQIISDNRSHCPLHGLA
jgi:hypothetical protein